MAMDEQDLAEQLDEDKVDGEYPPDRPLGVDTYGTTAAEERVGEPLVEAMAREEPDERWSTGDSGGAASDGRVERAVDDLVEVTVAQCVQIGVSAGRDRFVIVDDRTRRLGTYGGDVVLGVAVAGVLRIGFESERRSPLAGRP